METHICNMCREMVANSRKSYNQVISAGANKPLSQLRSHGVEVSNFDAAAMEHGIVWQS